MFTATASAKDEGEAGSTITLTVNVALATPSLRPTITKSLTIDTEIFTLSAAGDTVLDAAAGQTVTVNGAITGTNLFTKNGGGTTVFTGSSFYSGNYNSNEGTVAYRRGAQCTTSASPKGIFIMSDPGRGASLLVRGWGPTVQTAGK